MNNINRRNINTQLVFDEKYKANQRQEVNKKNYLKESEFRRKMYGLGNIDMLKKRDNKNNTVDSRVSNLNSKINSNKNIVNGFNRNNFLGKFK